MGTARQVYLVKSKDSRKKKKTKKRRHNLLKTELFRSIPFLRQHEFVDLTKITLKVFKNHKVSRD